MRSCLLRLLALAVVLVIGLIGVLYITNAPSPVGHFHTVDGEARYKRSYARAMETLPSPTRTTDVKTSYGSVRVYEFKTLNPDEHGAGIPVVLLPGRTSGVPMWATNIGGLLAQRTVYALDALGDAGMSVQTRAIESSADQGAWIEETFAQLGLASFHLVGHSFGGWLAANYAARHPARVQTLNLLEPVFVFQDYAGRSTPSLFQRRSRSCRNPTDGIGGLRGHAWRRGSVAPASVTTATVTLSEASRLTPSAESCMNRPREIDNELSLSSRRTTPRARVLLSFASQWTTGGVTASRRRHKRSAGPRCPPDRSCCRRGWRE